MTELGGLVVEFLIFLCNVVGLLCWENETETRLILSMRKDLTIG